MKTSVRRLRDRVARVGSRLRDPTSLVTRGHVAYEQGAHVQAFRVWREAAAKGSIEAAALIAKLYSEGKGVARSLPDAAIWYEKAARGGHAQSQFELGKILLNGFEPPLESSSAARWATNVQAKSEKSSAVFPHGVSIEKAPELGFSWIEKAATAGLPDAQVVVGDLLRAGRGCAQDLEAARAWYEKAAEQGAAGGEFGLGDTFYQGLGVEKDAEKALDWYRKAAVGGHVRAMTAVGYLYASGEGVERDVNAAVGYFQDAARHNDVNALFSLGKLHLEGAGLPKSMEKAETYLRKAGRRGHLPSMVKLGELYSRGFGAEPNLSEAASWYLLAAEKGDVASQFLLGRFYAAGTGVPPNARLAAKWFEKAAQAGHPAAAFQIGLCMLNGHGVKPDLQQAIVWLRKAAETGIGQAQIELGRIYSIGKGVPIDNDEAEKWLERAVALGDTKSIFSVVEVLLSTGKQAKARGLLERLAEGENGRAKLRLAQLLTREGRAPSDLARALQLYDEAGQLGYPEGHLAKGIYLMREETESFDFGLAEIVLRRAAGASDPKVRASAFFQLGVLFCRGAGENQNVSKGFAYYKEAAKLGHSIAQYNLAVMMQKGLGCPADSAGALVWLRKAAASGLSQAQVALADAKMAREPTEGISNDVLSLYQSAAGAGNRAAQARLKGLKGSDLNAPPMSTP